MYLLHLSGRENLLELVDGTNSKERCSATAVCLLIGTSFDICQTHYTGFEQP